MSSGPVFISHASRDDAFVRDLRLALEGQGIPVWVDSRNLRSGSALAPEIAQAIEEACQVIVVLSPNTIIPPGCAERFVRPVKLNNTASKDVGYRVLPLLLPGVEPTALELWFETE